MNFKIVKEQKILVLQIEYTPLDARERVFEYLETNYGKTCYSIKRSGPVFDKKDTGLVEAHVEI